MAKGSPKSVEQEDLAAVSSTAPPTHPVPQLQGPFEESILESMNDGNDRQEKVDSITRRKQLLERENYERSCAGRWKQRPGEKFHPLWKLVAQISFGIHLLAQRLAKSEEEVMKILQMHVDEIDGFLESTTEDFELAQKDIQDRIQLLRVPLENVKIFDTMLEDRGFRISIVEGNEKIEHTIDRTSRAMNDALKDVTKGIDAAKGLEKYLAEMNMGWEEKSQELEAVYLAMMSNVEGWNIAFMDLQMKGNSLGVLLVQLGGIIGEISKRAGIASRRTLRSPLPPITKEALHPKSPNKSLRTQSPRLDEKPLPEAPDQVEEAVQATLPKRHLDHKAVRRTSRNPSRREPNDQVKRVSQIRNSKSFPELSQSKLRHVSILDSRGRSPSVRRRLTKRQRPVRASITPRPTPPEKDTPKSLSRKSSFFSNKSTSPGMPKSSAQYLTRSSFFPAPMQEPITPGSVLSEPWSDTATSTSAAPAPVIPIRRQPIRDDLGANPNIKPIGRKSSKRTPVIIVDDTDTTASAPSECYVSAVEGDDEKTDSITALPQSPPSHDQLPLRRFLNLSRTPKTLEHTTAGRSQPQQFGLFPVRSFEHLNATREASSQRRVSPSYPPRPSSTPPFADKIVSNTPPNRGLPSPPPSFPSPPTPADSGKSTPKGMSPLRSPPDTPDSLLTALPSLPLPPRSKKRHQTKSAIAEYSNTSTDLLDLLASPPPGSSPIASPMASSPVSERRGHPNPLRSHAPAQTVAKLGGEPSSPPPPGPSGRAMVDNPKEFNRDLERGKSGSGGKKGLKRIFSRSQTSKRKTGVYIGGGDGRWFKEMNEEVVSDAGEGKKR